MADEGAKKGWRGWLDDLQKLEVANFGGSFSESLNGIRTVEDDRFPTVTLLRQHLVRLRVEMGVLVDAVQELTGATELSAAYLCRVMAERTMARGELRSCLRARMSYAREDALRKVAAAGQDVRAEDLQEALDEVAFLREDARRARAANEAASAALRGRP